MKVKWLKAIGREDWTPSKDARICSDHFKESQIKHDGKRVTLLKDTLPSRFNNSSHYTKVCPGNPLRSIYHDHNYNCGDFENNEECSSLTNEASEFEEVMECFVSDSGEVIQCVEGIECVLNVESSTSQAPEKLEAVDKKVHNHNISINRLMVLNSFTYSPKNSD